MLSLPPVALDDDEGEYELVLPLSSIQWIRLLAWHLDDRPNSELTQQFADSPALLIYGAASFQSKSAKPAKSLTELIDWFRNQVGDLFLRYDVSRSTSELNSLPNQVPKPRYEYGGNSSFRRLQKKYWRSSGRKRSRFLSKFLTKFLTLPKHRAKNLVARCAKGLLDELASKTAESELNRPRVWDPNLRRPCPIEAADDVALARLFAFYQNTAELRHHFQRQLQQEKLASLHQLAYGASHEINNPLANIATRAQTPLNSEKNPERRHKLGTIYEQAMRSHEMISDLLLFANPPAIQLERIDLRPFLSRLIRQANVWLDASIPNPSIDLSVPQRNGFTSQDSWMEPQTVETPQAKPIQMMVRIAPGIDFIDGDPAQLNVALMALIQNGIESLKCSTGRTLEFRISRKVDLILFEVVDDGWGVSSSIARHIFDPFFSGREAGRGLGFGLSKAWRIAQLHQGDLSFDPQHHPGARFVLEIPQVTR